MTQYPVCHLNVNENKTAATSTHKGHIISAQLIARKTLRKSLKSMLRKQADRDTEACFVKRIMKSIKRVLIHGSIGCLAGLLILHPMAMFINDIAKYKLVHFIPLQRIFASEHLLMSLYFSILGGVIGIVNAFYTRKRAKLCEEIKTLSITDELTSLYNRRHLMSQLKKEIERARRYSHDLSLLMIDINNFKQYNDTYGHQLGDELLKAVAMLLKNSVRKPDFVVRYGGDEFVIVMPEADKDMAIKLGERLLTEVKTRIFPGAATQTVPGLKISLGTATFPSEAQDMDGLITRADSMLYTMKKRST